MSAPLAAALRTAETVSAELMTKYGDTVQTPAFLKALLELAYQQGVCDGGERTGKALIEVMEAKVKGATQ